MQGWAILKERQSAIRFGIAWIVFFLSLGLCSTIVNYVEARDGFIFEDPLHFFTPRDFTYFILLLEYLCVGLGLRHALRSPENFIRLGYCYSLLFLLRAITLLSVPLTVPTGAIPLADPLVQLFTGGIQYQNNDLFFSGHTAFCFINYFLVPKGKLRTVIITASIVVGILLIAQRVHYTVDVVCAFPAAIIAYGLVTKINNYLLQKSFSTAASKNFN